MRRDGQTTPVMYALDGLSSAPARRHIVFYEERQQMAVRGGHLGPDDDLWSISAKCIPHPKGPFYAVVVGDGRHGQVASRKGAGYLRRTATTVTARRMNVDVGPGESHASSVKLFAPRRIPTRPIAAQPMRQQRRTRRFLRGGVDHRR